VAQLLELFSTGQHQFGLRVHSITPDQWDLPTPCAEWTVRDLVDHLITEQLWAAPLLAGKSLGEAERIVNSPTVTEDPVARWDTAAGASRVAFGEPGALDGTVPLSRGQTPASDYLNEMTLDLAIHAWDLGRSIGLTDPLPDDLVDYALEQAAALGDLSQTGVFAPAVQTRPDASAQDRLIALTGRQPA
jgi:uncharacterized protein (TIGR03086 family)